MDIEALFDDPGWLAGRPPAEVEAVLGALAGWRVEGLGRGSHAGGGWVLREYKPDGALTHRLIRWHPGGGRHGPEPYWVVADPRRGRSPRIT